MTPELTHDEVAALLSYCPESGVFRWKVDRTGTAKAGGIAGSPNDGGYWQLRIKGRSFKAHRLAFLLMTGKWPEQHVDHLDGNRQNNAWANLRDVSRAVNNQNQKKAHSNSTTGLLGVRVFRGRFQAVIQANGQTRHLGYYDCPHVAHAAYVAAKRLHHEGNTL